MARGTTKSQGNKHELDKFYTKDEVAVDLINLIPDLDSYDLIIEPSAGGGSFYRALKGMGYNVIGYDIEPECDGIIKRDWFTVSSVEFSHYNKILVIGNPPFGTSGNLALDFIKHAGTFATTIAMVLPKSFMKDTYMNKVPLNYWVDDSNGPRGYELGDGSFTLLGESYDVPCVFQIWHYRDELRSKTKSKSKSKYIDFVSKDGADFRVQRVGGNAGKASFNMDVAVASNYFVKVKDGISLTKEELVQIINQIEYPTINYTVGPRSLSKTELIIELENRIEGM